MPRFPFPYDIKVYVIGDDRCETAYYTYQKQAYKRTRKLGEQTWQDTAPIPIDRAEFWMTVACIDRMREY
jgi:hypothetical protein